MNINDLDASIKACLVELKNDEENYLRNANDINEDSLIAYFKQYYKHIKELYDKDLEEEINKGIKCTDALELKTLHYTIKGLLDNFNQTINYIYDSVYESGIISDILLEDLTREDKDNLLYLKGSEDVLFWSIYAQYELNKLERKGNKELIERYKCSDKYNIVLSLDLIIDKSIEDFIDKKIDNLRKEVLPTVCENKGICVEDISEEYFNKVKSDLNDNLIKGLDKCYTKDELIIYLTAN